MAVEVCSGISWRDSKIGEGSVERREEADTHSLTHTHTHTLSLSLSPYSARTSNRREVALRTTRQHVQANNPHTSSLTITLPT